MAVNSFENTMEKAVSFNGEEMEALRKILSGEENPIQDEKKLKMTVNVHDVIIVLFDTPSIRISVIHARL